MDFRRSDSHLRLFGLEIPIFYSQRDFSIIQIHTRGFITGLLDDILALALWIRLRIVRVKRETIVLFCLLLREFRLLVSPYIVESSEALAIFIHVPD